MVYSKKNDSDIDSDYSNDSSPPKTEEDIFRDINGSQLPPRQRKARHVLGTTPPPTKKKNTKKKTKAGPLVNSALTNQSSNSSNNKKSNKKKRGRKSSKSLPPPPPIGLAPGSFPASSALEGNYIFVIIIYVSRIPTTSFLEFVFPLLTF